MPIAVFFVYFLLHVSMFALTFKWGDLRSIRLNFLRLMLFGMAYDNLMVVLGPVLIESDIYLALNYPRYVMHTGVLPFLTIFALSILQQAQIEAANKKLFIGICWFITTVSWWYGVFFDLSEVELAPELVMGYDRFVNQIESLPYATIFTNFFVVMLGVLLWWRTQWPWLCLGGLFIFVLNAAFGAMPWGSLTGNGAEVVLSLLSCSPKNIFKTHALDNQA